LKNKIDALEGDLVMDVFTVKHSEQSSCLHNL